MPITRFPANPVGASGGSPGSFWETFAEFLERFTPGATAGEWRRRHSGLKMQMPPFRKYPVFAFHITGIFRNTAYFVKYRVFYRANNLPGVFGGVLPGILDLPGILPGVLGVMYICGGSVCEVKFLPPVLPGNLLGICVFGCVLQGILPGHHCFGVVLPGVLGGFYRV